ncbi:glycosyltransferase [Apibacter sp. HY039]|uniref:glycosyltransferase n=1 Tax=Apibacter sp. HY039 TaxID=2501476 RepID=UPI000FEC09D1|nr:glycosyltransferase [Apibacter sp. HY039]
MAYKVSIIVPVYNVEKYLSKCIDSLINQTLQEIEIVLINDGSTDGSQIIIDSYTKKNTNIVSICKTNGGLSEARNLGIKKATGEYIAFVDSDDWVEKEMMSDLYFLGKKHNADIVFCNLQNVDEKGEIFKLLPQLPQLSEKIILEEDFTVFGEMSCFACNKIFKRELFNYIEFPSGLHFEDIATIPRLFLKSKVIAKSNKYLYNYFVRKGSITRNYTSKGLDMFKAIGLVKEDFSISIYKNNTEDWEKFVILQGFYSFLAYYAYVKDSLVKKNMIIHLKNLLKEENISKSDIIYLKRYNKFYLFSLSYLKIVFYTLNIIRL